MQHRIPVLSAHQTALELRDPCLLNTEIKLYTTTPALTHRLMILLFILVFEGAISKTNAESRNKIRKWLGA